MTDLISREAAICEALTEALAWADKHRWVADWQMKARAALAAQAAAVKVKPLVWDQVSDSRGGVVAMGVSGAYIIRRLEDDKVRMTDASGSGWQRFENEDVAKAAAQADYEARILAAIEPAAQGGAA